MQWTRVMTLKQMIEGKINTYSISNDIKTDASINKIRQSINLNQPELLFDKEQFKDQPEILTIEQQKLSDVQLLDYA